MLDIRPLTNTQFASNLSHLVCCLFTFLMFSEAQKSLILMKSKLFIFLILLHIFLVLYIRILCRIQVMKSYSHILF